MGAGTAGLNVPMFIALRRFTLLFTILLERYWLKKHHDWPTLSAMFIMIGGEAGAGRRDVWLVAGRWVQGAGHVLVRRMLALGAEHVVPGLCSGRVAHPVYIRVADWSVDFALGMGRTCRQPTHPHPGSPVVRSAGALIAAATDLSFNPRGYAAVLCNDLLTSLYLIMVKNTPGTNGLR